MNTERVREILEMLSRVKIAVYGDFGLDAYWILNPKGGEISAETGLQSQGVSRHYYRLGGASNVAANLAALNPAQTRAIGVLGDDIFGRELSRQLAALGVDIGSMVVQEEGFDTYVFGKVILNDKEQPRIDFGFFNERSARTDDLILSNIRDALQNCDAVIFNQQVPGSLNNNQFISEVNGLFEKFEDRIVLLDTRHYGDRFKRIYRKLNEIEAARLNGVDVRILETVGLADLRLYTQRLYEDSGKPVFVTRGSQGILTASQDGLNEIPGIKLTGNLDPVGAGDAVVSALALCLGAGMRSPEAAKFANLAAAVTVQKLFECGTASGEEILELCSRVFPG